MCCDGCCSWWCCVLWGIGWWVVASLLFFYCWNKILVTVSALKPIKIIQAMLIVLTIAVLLAPSWCRNCGSCGSSGSCSHYECCSPGCCESDSLKH